MSNTVDGKEQKQVVPTEEVVQEVKVEEVNAAELDEVNGGASGGWSIGIAVTVPF